MQCHADGKNVATVCFLTGPQTGSMVLAGAWTPAPHPAGQNRPFWLGANATKLPRGYEATILFNYVFEISLLSHAHNSIGSMCGGTSSHPCRPLQREMWDGCMPPEWAKKRRQFLHLVPEKAERFSGRTAIFIHVQQRMLFDGN